MYTGDKIIVDARELRVQKPSDPRLYFLTEADAIAAVPTRALFWYELMLVIIKETGKEYRWIDTVDRPSSFIGQAILDNVTFTYTLPDSPLADVNYQGRTFGLVEVPIGDIGDMLKATYDPANKNNQVLTISDLPNLKAKSQIKEGASINFVQDATWVSDSNIMTPLTDGTISLNGLVEDAKIHASAIILHEAGVAPSIDYGNFTLFGTAFGQYKVSVPNTILIQHLGNGLVQLIYIQEKVSVPNGGAKGTVLTKNSATDGDASFSSLVGAILDPITFDVDRTGSYTTPFDGTELRLSVTDAQAGKVAVIPVLRNTAPTLTELAGITIVKTEGQFVENELTPQILTLTHLRDGEVIARWHSASQQITTIPFAYTVACSDETTDVDLIDPAIVFRMPFACTLTEVRASVNVAQASGSLLTVDIKAGGTTIFGGSKITLDNTEKTSVTATTPAILNTTVIADDTEMQVLIPQLGAAGAKGLKVTFIGVRSI